MKKKSFHMILWGVISFCILVNIDVVSGAKKKPGKKAKKDGPSIKSCKDAQDEDSSGKVLQTIHPGVGKKSGVEVICDFETDGGGWTLIQKRGEGQPDEFDRNWYEYSYGFGSAEGNYWIGLEKIYAMTRSGDQELRIDLEDFQGEKAWAKYSNFSVSGEKGFFTLKVGGYDEKSTAGNAFFGAKEPKSVQNGMKFSTSDKDNDLGEDKNCAEKGGGWWFADCGQANLNGPYKMTKAKITNMEGIVWATWKDESTPLAKAEMKIRTRTKK